MRRHAAAVGMLLLGLLVGVLLLAGVVAYGEPPAQTAAVTPTDPTTMIVTGIVQLATSTPGGIAVLLGGLYGLGPRLSTRLGIGTDPAVTGQLARHDERSRETRREVRRLRRDLHWMSTMVSAIAVKAGITVPPPPTESLDDDTESDEPRVTGPTVVPP